MLKGEILHTTPTNNLQKGRTIITKTINVMKSKGKGKTIRNAMMRFHVNKTNKDTTIST